MLVEKRKGRKAICRNRPFNHSQKLSFKDVQFADGDATDFGVECIVAENIAKTFAGDRDGCYDKAMASKRRECEERDSGAYLVDVVKGD
jgi:hypothetical protein